MSVTEAGAELADKIGLEHLNMVSLAEDLGVKTPSLYKHVDSLADVTHRIAALALTELADAICDATQGRAGSDALTAAAQATRNYAKSHPGRYAAGNGARPTGPDDPLTQASSRLLSSLSAILRGYRLDLSQEIHALRALRSMMHGFATLEAVGGFQINTDIDQSFTWMINLIDQGLQANRSEDGPSQQDRHEASNDEVARRQPERPDSPSSGPAAHRRPTQIATGSVAVAQADPT